MTGTTVNTNAADYEEIKPGYWREKGRTDGPVIGLHASMTLQEYFDRVAAKDAAAAAITSRREEIAALPDVEALAGRLRNATPAQIDAWFVANMTNLAQARVVIATLTKLLATRL
jgi:hypothetical protein